MTTEATLYGRGVSFSPRLGADGRLAWSDGQQNIRESIRVILSTDPGERVMLPAFGAGLRSFLFEPNVASTHRLIENRVQHALLRWEPRIQVDAVRVERDPEDDNQANVHVEYTLVATRERGQVTVTTPVGG